MGQHGFISWADDDKECYQRTLDFIERASQFIEKKYAAKGGDAKAFGGAKFQRSRRKGATRSFRRRSCRGCAARFRSRKRFIAHDPGRREDPALREFRRTRRAWPSSARVAPTIFCARKSSRFTSTGIRKPEDVAVLEKEARRRDSRSIAKDYAAYYAKCKHANSPAMRDPNPDGDSDSRPGHDCVGQGQERVARDGGVLQLRRRGHARRGGD